MLKVPALFLPSLLKLCLVFVAILFCFNLIFLSPVFAATEIPIEVKVSLGNSAGELRFFPNNLEFQAGKTYQLVLSNPSPTKHYFTAKDFADASWTKKVDTGKVEVKGAIHELEIRSDGSAQWVLVPMKTGSFELHCSVSGHAEAGMTGKIAIVNRLSA
jgi:uncharacterized cupredoxin-like copper-binding protein